MIIFLLIVLVLAVCFPDVISALIGGAIILAWWLFVAALVIGAVVFLFTLLAHV